MYVNPLQFYTSEIIYKLMGENREKKMKCVVASTSTHLGFLFVLHMQLSYLKKNKLLVCKKLEINLFLFFIF